MLLALGFSGQLQSATEEELRPQFGRTLLPSVLRPHEVPLAQRSGREGRLSPYPFGGLRQGATRGAVPQIQPHKKRGAGMQIYPPPFHFAPLWDASQGMLREGKGNGECEWNERHL